ncbi:MAG TPA: MerR family transcriptional regulator [Clostridiales bacterium]|nr:MerR family transcriptional regulator [Clostridiales bacterium]
MSYTIKQVADLTGLSEATLRYYDKEGLFPYMERKSSGYRLFSEKELEQIRYIECFKTAGFEIKDIKEYFDLIAEGDGTLEKRLQIMKDHRKVIENRMAELEKSIRLVDKKIDYYTRAVEKGTAVGITMASD